MWSVSLHIGPHVSVDCLLPSSTHQEWLLYLRCFLLRRKGPLNIPHHFHCGQYFESISLNCPLVSLMDVGWSHSKLPEEENNDNNNNSTDWRREVRDSGSLDTENTAARRMSITNAIDILRERLVLAIRRRQLNVSQFERYLYVYSLPCSRLTSRTYRRTSGLMWTSPLLAECHEVRRELAYVKYICLLNKMKVVEIDIR